MSEIITDIRKAFDIFWDKLNVYYEKKYNTKPTVCYTKKLNPDLFFQIYSTEKKKYILCEADEEGYIQWQPMLQQEPVDFNAIENHIGFKLMEELKDYYSTYLFLELCGKLDHDYINFQPIFQTQDVTGIVIIQYEDARIPFPDSQIFCLGNAIIEDIDHFGVYYDNLTGKVFGHDYESNRVVPYGALSKTIAEMEAVG